MQLKRTMDLQVFKRAPVGAALVGDGWLHFCAHARLFGVVLWGRPGAAEMSALVRSLQLELEESVAPHHSLVDVSRIEGVDAAAFEALNRYVVAHRAPLSRAVTRLALVRPTGLPGAVTSGFYAVSGSPYPVELFDDARAALTWLGDDDGLAAAIDSLVDDVTGAPAVVSGLRVAVSANLTTSTLSSSARALGVSERTLQRRLKDAGTSFASELLEARLREAQRRMRDTDEPLATIALDVGFSSQQHFSTAFREATGEQPSAWRKRQPAFP